ncbi:hypothetical protein DEJ23_11585 [Curtobacterium sp. MCSS17_008]|uniref:hypothetical protein n=1 Tax=Curtobacterium sp. MCSS17_008 TaxID=2175647 RepID=UPI000DA91C1F|nr:hypothetical protein [Curtobacterium sp. MCSS17_008]PZF55550.1 hypothetical protein DEJ23_11585 [Curtobacterium sp. MCSS17_008]
MTPRTALALGAAALALTVGVVGADATVLGGATPASAAEDRSDVTATDAPVVRVTDRELRRVDTIELGAEGLVFQDDDDTVADVSMRDARSTVGLLNRLLGTPSRTQTAVGDGGACFPSGTTYTWGGAVRVAALGTPSSVGNAVEIRVLKDSVRSRTGGRVDLTGPDGVQIGDDVEDELQAAPKADKVSFGSGDSRAWQLLLEPGWEPDDDESDAPRAHAPRTERGAPGARPTDAPDDEQGTNGVSALTNGTEVTVIGSPMPVHTRRSC